MADQEILKGAPKGATHYECGEYMRNICDDRWEYWSKVGDWQDTHPESETRSLADIRRIVELENKNAKMLECLCDISDACIGQLTMNYSLDAEGIANSIYEATGMTNSELNAALKEQVKL